MRRVLLRGIRVVASFVSAACELAVPLAELMSWQEQRGVRAAKSGARRDWDAVLGTWAALTVADTLALLQNLANALPFTDSQALLPCLLISMSFSWKRTCFLVRITYV